MNFGIIVQARMRSSRFPGKVLKKIQNKTLLELQINRLKHSQKVDMIIVATSVEYVDNKIFAECERLGIPCFRGSENNVLERFYQAAKYYDIDVIIRTNADCPFIDAIQIDKLIDIWNEKYPNIDYVSNILEESFPLGMHIEIFSKEAIKIALEQSIDKDEHEHVTAYIYRNNTIFRILNVLNDEDLSNYRWTIDYPEDFLLVKEVYKNFGVANSKFTMTDLVYFFKANPELQKINSQYKKKQSIL